MRLLAITVLTSLDEASLSSVMGGHAGVEETVSRWAGLALVAGIDGVVSSVAECRAVKEACGPEFLVVTPGIRPVGEGSNDQKRVATPEEALARGADYLVIGRPITRAADPSAAAAAIAEHLGHGDR